MTELLPPSRLARMERVRTNNPYSLSIEELATRQIAMNSRRVSGGVAFVRKTNSSEKNMARGRIVSLFKRKRWDRGLSILTMPSLDWTFETRLLSVREGNWQNRTNPARSTHITSVELDPAIYACASVGMPKTAKASIVTYLKSPQWTAHATGSDAIGRFYNCDVFDLMAHNGKTFDAAWLDFTGPLTAQRMDRIASFYKDHIAAILVVTFLGARYSGESLHEIAENDGVLGWLRSRLKGNVLHALRYQDGPSPMIQYAVAKRGCGYKYGAEGR